MTTAYSAFACAIGLAWPGLVSPALAASPAGLSAPADERTPETVTQLADWVAASGDNRDLPFAIVDKTEAQVFVFAPDGRLLGASPALVGFARGDDSAPGVGDRELSDIRPEERTTPAGRFVAAYGPAKGRDRVLWVDYATAVSLHEVVTSNRRERRLQRLRSPTPEDNRITYGCINVSSGFYRTVVRPTFEATGGVFYVLPETRPLEEAFPTYRPLRVAASGG